MSSATPSRPLTNFCMADRSAEDGRQIYCYMAHFRIMKPCNICSSGALLAPAPAQICTASVCVMEPD